MAVTLLELGLVATLGFVAMLGLASWAAIGAVKRWLQMPTRLDASHSVPLRWRWSMSPTASLHRRLKAAVAAAQEAWVSLGHPLPLAQPARRRQQQSDPWWEPLESVMELALDVDQRLARAERSPQLARRAVAQKLESRVSEIEALSRRYCASVEARLRRRASVAAWACCHRR